MGIEPKFIVISRSVQNLWQVEFFIMTAKYAYLDVISKNSTRHRFWTDWDRTMNLGSIPIFSGSTNALGVSICMYYIRFKSYGLKAKIDDFSNGKLVIYLKSIFQLTKKFQIFWNFVCELLTLSLTANQKCGFIRWKCQNLKHPTICVAVLEF